MNKRKYSLGLSSFSIMRSECITATQIYLELKDWISVRERLVEENLLQRTHRSTAKVAAKEVTKRLRHGNQWELELIAHGKDLGDVSFLCMLMVARQYPILVDCTTDLIQYKFQGADNILEPFEIEMWYRGIGSDHPEIEELKPGSFERLKGNTKLILLEGGILRKTREGKYKIEKPRISTNLEKWYHDNGSIVDLRMLLYSENEIVKILEER